MTLPKILAQSFLWRGLYFFTLLLLNVFVSRYFQAGNAGWIFYLSNLFSFVLLVASLSAESGMTYYASRNDIAAGKLVSFIFLWVILIAAVIFLFFSNVLAYMPEQSIGRDDFLFFSICYIPGILLTNYFTMLFYVQRNYLLPNLLMSLLNVALIFIIARQTPSAGYDPLILHTYFLYFIATGISLALAYWLVNRHTLQLAMLSQREFIKLMRFSLKALLANVLFFLVYRIDYWFVKNSPSCSSADLGNYIQASKLGQMLLIIPQIIAAVIFPQTASGAERATINTSITIISRLFSQAFLLILAIVLISGRWLFPFVFGESFQGIYLPFMLLLPGIFCLSVLAMLSAYFSGKGKVNVNVTGAAISLMVVVTGDYLFIPNYGIAAAAIISTLGYATGLAYSLYCFYKDYKVNLSSFFAWRRSDYGWLAEMIDKKKK
ncbi:polysaccharide biosynthesis C-terminal domain-containing protein [Foetidibacter luteolus]|uniref:polysaccharide biosynthesis C-terminal domain-containing protein n=1 Tax=Foetidibacter luteolus TaxID=2608880 RepID=UPI00129AB61A|nr:polysaccharide biosynthesis C-terminal domain-containing protein [Foetidibacter luteolus]